MQTYVILRRSAWDSEDELEAADMDKRVKWIRSYVLAEEDGTVGTVCIYQAEDEEAIIEHAQRAELPADEIIAVSGTVIIRDDP